MMAVGSVQPRVSMGPTYAMDRVPTDVWPTSRDQCRVRDTINNARITRVMNRVTVRATVLVRVGLDMYVFSRTLVLGIVRVRVRSSFFFRQVPERDSNTGTICHDVTSLGRSHAGPIIRH